MTTSPAISLADVTFHYGTAHDTPFSLHIRDLLIPRGEVVACIGDSGSGKTTLLHLLAGILTPAGGEITILGTALTTLPDHARRSHRLQHIGMVFQEFELLEYLSAADNITLSSQLGQSHDAAALRRRAAELAAHAGITHALTRKPRQLSQGERQRVAICRALAPKPDLILCDEPTGNLDPDATCRIVALLIERARADHATLLFVTHNHTLLDRFDRTLSMTDLAAIHRGAPGVLA